MRLDFAEEEDLIERIAARPERVVYLVGPSVSAPAVPDADRLIQLARELLGPASRRLDEHLARQPEDRRYEAAFQHIQHVRGPEFVQQVIRRAVLSARRPSRRFPVVQADVDDEKLGRDLEDDGDGWALPPGIAAIGQILARTPPEPQPLVLTTSFDPLLRISVARAGGSAQSIAFDGDGSFYRVSGAACLIGQLHGDWIRGDTLHAPAQLGRMRPMLEASLQRLLSERTLVVLGHEGHDDITTRALSDLVRGDIAPFDVLWTFQGDNASQLEAQHAALLVALGPGIERGRIFLYRGIDPHRSLPKLATRLEATAATTPPAEVHPAATPHETAEFRPHLRPGVRLLDSRTRAELRKKLARLAIHRVTPRSELGFAIDPLHTELETEVEVEGASVVDRWLHRRSRGSSVRIEPSLTRALERNADRIVLLVGEPGCGKTVALHHVERELARRIGERADCRLPLPLCVRLRRVQSGPGRPIDKVWTCVLRTLDAKDLANAERLFWEGAEVGGWLLLLDGFDEIPEVLSAFEATEQVREYALAIDTLRDEVACVAEGACRIVVATRPYHGPKELDWPRFRLLPLSTTLQAAFIRNLGLSVEQATKLTDRLATESLEVQHWAHNPLMLAMLCEVIKGGGEPPRNLHTLFDLYIKRRLAGDVGRARELYGGSVARLYRSAEAIGFVMSAEPGLGLAPTTPALRAALLRHGFPVKDLERTLVAIEGLELTIRESSEGEVHTGFRHRRLQEYFAACVYLDQPGRVPPERLLFDASWRESVVAQLQQRPLTELGPVLACAEAELRAYQAELDVPLLAVDPALPRSEAMKWMIQQATAPETAARRLRWPHRLVHLLEILQTGSAVRTDLPADLRRICISLVLHEYRFGTRIDKKAALEVAGVLPAGFLEGLAAVTFERDSELLRELAFKQLPRLGAPLSPALQGHIARLLVRMAASGALVADRGATQARIRCTGDDALGTLFAMVSAAVVSDRVIRHALLAAYAAIYILFGSVVWILPTSEEATPAIKIVFIGLLSLPLIGFLRLREVRRYEWALIRTCVGLVLLMFIAIVPFVGAKKLGLGLPAAIGGLLLLFYVYLLPTFALVAVWFAMPVRRFAWPLLPILLAWRGARQRYVAPIVVAMAALMWLARWSLPELPNDLPLTATVLLILVAGGTTAAAGSLVLPMIWAHCMDWRRSRAMARQQRVLTGSALRDELAAYRTPEARNALLREALTGRRVMVTADAATQEDLEATLIALENHADAMQQAPPRQPPFTLRVWLPADYVNGCRSEHARWCLEHFTSIVAATDLTVTLDLLTRLLDNVERSMMSVPPSGSCASPPALPSTSS